ncbi:hypothetical protein SMC26_40745 [Actinomadura fulvescens]|uniref:Uncharacterized protein n=1 Tax=Actinomadura fulvescens TaxID=46160 RepID=A0ABN3QZ54_9ACTN
MNDLERRVGKLLVEPFTEIVPPQDLATRLVRRTRKRQRRLAMASVAAAATLVVAPVVIVQTVKGPAQQPPSQRGAVPTAKPPLSGAIDSLVDRRSITRIPRRLAAAPPFNALALGSDGTVLGAVERGSGEDEVPATGVWRVRPGGKAPQRVLPRPSEHGAFLWSMAAGDAGYIWPSGEGLTCLGPNGRTPAVKVSAEGGTAPFFADGPSLMWSEKGAIKLSNGCGGAVSTFPTRADLVAFSYPHAFLRNNTGLQQLDVRSGRIRRLNTGRVSDSAVVAAGSSVLAWTDGEALVIHDRQTGTTRRALTGLPNAEAESYFSHLTTNGHVVVYSVQHQDDTADSSAVAYGLRTGNKFELPGHAWVAGGYVLWRDTDEYLLAKLRPEFRS